MIEYLVGSSIFDYKKTTQLLLFEPVKESLYEKAYKINQQNYVSKIFYYYILKYIVLSL